MLRVYTVRRTATRVALVMAFLGLACQQKQGGGRSAAETRAELLAEADSNYTYGPERDPVRVDTTALNAPGGALPVITIATATRKSGSGRVPTNRFSSRLNSSAAYATMGIAPGMNYLWQDPSSTGRPADRFLIVPRDAKYPMTWLRRDTTVVRYFPAPAPEPRLVRSAKGYAVCQMGCEGGHCAMKEATHAYADGDAVTIRIKPR